MKQRSSIAGMCVTFPISRDPPEGGTSRATPTLVGQFTASFQFLGIPPKGELFPFITDHVPPPLVSNF